MFSHRVTSKSKVSAAGRTRQGGEEREAERTEGAITRAAVLEKRFQSGGLGQTFKSRVRPRVDKKNPSDPMRGGS